jgi:hypothetical protein
VPPLTLLGGVERPDRSQGSVFAVIAEANQQTVEALVAQRHSFDLAVAFLVSQRNVSLARKLRAAGWICIPVSANDAVESVWHALGEAQESSHARG